MRPNPCIFLSAGEASGDHYGAQLVSELHSRLPQATFFGLGGHEMEEAGVQRVARAEDVAHMGITEVLLHMPRIYGKYRQLVTALKKQRPDVAVLIDFPDVNFRLARELKELGVPVVWFVSPQLWAWKRRRLRWVQERVDRMMVIFPFEETFYRARGVDATFVGHPLAEMPLQPCSRYDYAALYGLDPEKPWVALLPGSRRKEVLANLGEMLETAKALNQTSECEYLIPIASTLDQAWLKQLIEAYASDKRNNAARLPGVTLVDDAREALFHARASVVASGTATVLAAVVGNPFVVVYRVSDMTYRAAKYLIHYPPEIPAEVDGDGNLPVGMVNLVAGRRVVPELLQGRFTAENVAAALRPLLTDGPERQRMMAELAEVRAKLLPREGLASIQTVADAVEELLAS
jgi:lipid-A-disaccharide synthase